MMRRSFRSQYDRLQPVQVTTPFGGVLIPVGFVVFDNGIGYSDDGVLQEFPSHFPIHQLVGDIVEDGPRLLCQGHIFEVMPSTQDKGLWAAWDWINDTIDRPIEFRLNIENAIRSDRARRYTAKQPDQEHIRQASADYGEDEKRDCFRDPIPEIFDAATLLDEAVHAHNSGRTATAEVLIRAADMPRIGEWLDSIWLAKTKYRNPRPVAGLPPIVEKTKRFQPRMPVTAMKRELIARDGYHCRFCGIPLVRAEMRKLLTALYPDAARWTGVKENQQHRGLQAMWLQYDHVIVHSRGGETTLENMVVACPACNFGRDKYMLEEVGLRDPRSAPRSIYWHGRSTWDGLERINGLVKPA